MLQHFAQVVSLAIAVVGIALFVKAIRQIVGVVRTGQPLDRADRPGRRTATMLKESLGHTRMLQWTWMGAGHWFVFIGFGLLFFTLVTAFGQLFDPHFAIPFLGNWFLFEWVSELFTLVMLVAIIAFIGYRATRPKERTRGVKGRFFGSTMWQGYFVELVILGVGICIVLLRGAEFAQAKITTADAANASAFHYPFSIAVGQLMDGMSAAALANLIYVVAMAKIVISFVWMITISLQPTMGVAWHRFLAFFNIWFRREADGRTALGALKPMMANGEVIDLEDLEELDEDTKLGVGSIEDFAWKGILDFTTCTECGRCQSQCPAWNTDKPLSPKMVMLNLRNHAHMKAPYLQAASEEERAELPAAVLTEAERPLVGATEGFAWGPDPVAGSAVIDDDVLWSCTTCGACVQQCPVDIEHVDHIVDMRRYQVLVESNFPSELNGLFKGMESKGNPWNMNPNGRLEWAQGLDFPVKVVGGDGSDDPEDLSEVDWLFWVGCAGAYEDRAKKTTRAVAELLNMAGVDFAVLGNGETCTGDPARRAGNEFVFQGLASQNAETFKEMKAKKVVATCAHCFNTLKNEYSQFGAELEVVHHTQLLNRLVREKKLTPVAVPEGQRRTMTYHDPCYLGRHNQVYTPPRELLEIIPDADFREMPRNSERSFCCGAGGARMWMEEKIGERINRNRTKEAVATGADQIAVGCPFCRVMLSDGLVAEQQDGNAREEVEILDVAQLLLASVKGEPPTKAKVSVGTAAKAGEAAAGTAAAAVATQDEPDTDDATQTADTVTATEEVGAAAQAHTAGGGSLFDDAPTPKDAEDPTDPPEVGSSLFDVGGADAEPAAPKAAAEPKEEAKPEPKAEAEATQPASGSSSGSLFDIAADEPAAKTEPAGGAKDTADDTADAKAEGTAEPKAEATADSTSEATTAKAPPASEIGSGSLFDIAAPEAPAAQATPAVDEPASNVPSPDEPAEPASDAGANDPANDSANDSANDPTAAPERAEEEPESANPEAAATPASEIGSGSLFDIAAPEASAGKGTPTEDRPTAEKPAPEKPAEPAAAEEPAAEQTAEPAADAEPEDETPAEPAAAADGPIRSLKDIKAEHDGTSDGAASPTPPQPAAEPEPEAAAEPESEPDEAAGEPDEPGDEPDEPGDEPAAEPEDEEKPAPSGGGAAPASSGEAHQPKTDADIGGAGSLFDL